MNPFLHKKSPQFQLLVVFMGSAVLMLLYEAVKDWMSAGQLALWQSHAITILVSAALATVASFHVRRWARALDSELEMNIARRHQAEAFGRAMLDAAPVGILAYRTTGQCVMANPIAAALVGASQDDLLAQNFRALSSWKSSGLLAAADGALAGNGKEQREVRFTSTFGHDVWAEAIFVPFMLDDQLHVLLMLRDVTEARRAARALAESERAFRSLADNIPDNLIRCDCDGRLLYVNRTLEAVLGKTSAELRGNTAEQNYPDGRFAKLDQAMRQAGATGEAMEFELEYPAVTGTMETHSIRIVPELDAQRRCGSVLAIGRDITHKKQLEDELRLAASVFHASSEGVLVTDADATIISTNPAFSDITGYAAAEAIGRKPNLLRSDRHDEEFYRQLWETLLATGSWQGEIWNRRKTGEAYLEWLTINRIADEAGKTVRFVSVFHDITESRRKDERIRHLAFHDALTGLPNRALFQERLGHAIERARRNDEYLSVTFIDLDGFKNVNDTLGHDVGDLLLQEVAQRIRVRLRRGADTVARLGGDEFVVLMENLKEAEHCASLAGEIIGDLSQPYVIRGTTCHVGASMGIAFYPGDGQTSNDLMKHADTAMYSAKLAGKGTYRFFSSEMLQSVTERLAMEDDLRQAIDREELVLHYQPKIRMHDGKVRGVEALIRWQHPSRGLVLPGDFIPLAEETGMIHAIGDWVLEAACGQLQEWQRKGVATPIAVNVSAAQLTKGKLPERVAGLLDRYRIPATWLHIEITESALMADTEKAVETLEKLRALGLSIAIDDFGTGYSSLSRLRQLPVDVLKIDRSFVANADRNDKDAQVVRMVVALAESLGLDIVAEGVESVEQVALLRSTGCSVCQGHYFAQAQPAWEIEKLLSKADAQ